MVRLILASLFASLAAGCYQPTLNDCTVECAPGGGCPAGLTCSEEGFCRSPGAATSCAAIIDAATLPADAGAPDGRCGDRVIQSNEQCDDGDGEDGGNRDDRRCLSNCTWAACGDSKVRAGVEECESPTAGCASCMLCDNDGASVGAVSYGGHCYRRFDTDANYDTASASCRSRSAYLATLTAEVEWSPVQAALQSALNCVGCTLWIGLARPAAGQAYRWWTGDALGFHRFVAPEPDTDAGCVVQARSDEVTADTTNWSTRGCNLTAGYICEKDGWIIAASNHHAYRAFTETKTWDEARAICQAFPNGHLATIATDEERNILATIGQRTIQLWIGANDFETENTYVWITGEPAGDSFSTTSPNRWAQLNPNPAELDTEDCIYILYDTNDTPGFKLHDHDCGTEYAFLCEIE